MTQTRLKALPMSAMSSGLLRTLAKRIRGRSHLCRSTIRKNATMCGFEICSIVF